LAQLQAAGVDLSITQQSIGERLLVERKNRGSMLNLRRICFLLLAAVLIVSSALAQQTIGTIKGTLTDDSGAVIPAVNVVLTGSGTSKTVQTQSDGSYTFVGVQPGQYTINVSYPGFAPAVKPVAVTAGNTVQVPVQLSIVAEKQSVTVKAETGVTVSVEPDNNATALVLKGDDLAALPDDPDDLSDALQALAGPGAGPNGGSIYIDGFSGGQIPPKESIREIRINQNPFSAEYDKLGFGRIEILTKPGSDHFRGTVGFNDTEGTLDSRNPFESNKPPYHSRMYHANLSGPISKRSSFFMDFNRRDVTGNAITNAFFVDPTTFAVSPFQTAVVTPQTNTTFAPRVDYQISTNNTLMVRAEERLTSNNNSGLGGYKLPPPYSDLAYNTTGNNQNIMVTETSILNPKIVNETRFQFTRALTQENGNEFPEISVSNAFVTGGNGLGNSSTLTKHFELQNYTSISHGVHTIRFGVRARRESDGGFTPNGFNGTFSFFGGLEPVLNASNQIVFDANGNEQMVQLTSLQQYQRQLMLAKLGIPEAQIQTLGGGPSQFNINSGQAYISSVRYDAAPFIQDDWRVKPNLTISLGLRYEWQTLVSDNRDIAPRFGFAWAPGKAKNGRQKTVLRGGFGMFYDRVGTGLYEQAREYNGSYQLSYTVSNPTFYPNIPVISTLTPSQNSTYVVDPRLRADYLMQTAIGVERQLPRNTTMAVTYTNTRANHLSQTVDINAPIPGTFTPGNLTTGLRPYGNAAGNIFEYQSGGLLKQNIIMANFNTRFSRRVTLFGNYQRNYANALSGTPTDPYNYSLDYGRSTLATRDNFQLTGSILAPMNIRLSPFLTVRSGTPYDVNMGTDYYNNLVNSARPAFAPAGSTCGVNGIVCTPVGNFFTAPTPGVATGLVPINYLTGAALVSINTRIGRTFGFGPKRGGNANALMNGGGGGPDGGGPGGGGPPGGGFGGGGGGGPRGGGGGAGGGGGGGGRGMSMGGGGARGGRGGGGGDLTEHRFNLTVSANITNILNHVNPGGYQGVITSPQFGMPTSVNTSFGGGPAGRGGGGGAANNRRIDFSTTLTF
jgi:hypothetical protein